MPAKSTGAAGSDRKVPGAMKEKDLARELCEVHGWDQDRVAALSWREKIDAVTALRQVEGLFIPDPETHDFVFNGHHGTGPSGAERWMTCTASLQMTRNFIASLSPSQMAAYAKAGTAAAQGTTAHRVAEVEVSVLLGHMTEDEAGAVLADLAALPSDAAYDDEMAEYVTEYVDLIRQYIQSDRQVLIERPVEAWVPLTGEHEGEEYPVRGSADAIILPSPDEPDLVVADLKYGEHIDVDPEGNPQVRLYGLGALGLLADEDGTLPDSLEKITYHIVQPRQGGIKTWSESIDDLLEWRDEVASSALTAALFGPEAGAEFSPSDEVCRFCPARGGCDALAESRLAAADELFDIITDTAVKEGPDTLPDVTVMDDARLGSLLEQIEGLEDLRKSMRQEAERRLLRGHRVPGFKLVTYSPPRKWDEMAEVVLDPQDHDTSLDDEVVADLWKPPTLKGVKQVEETLKKAGLDKDEVADLLGGLFVKPDPIPKIAPADDRRKEWQGPPPEAMFDALGEDA